MNEHKVASIFPEMSAEEFLALVEDIRQNGLRNPIVRFEGAVLDGRHRLKACAEAGVEPGFVDFAGTAAEAIRFVWSENFGRRHLTSSQKAMCAVDRELLEESYGLVVAELRADAKQRQDQTRGRERDEKGRVKPPRQFVDAVDKNTTRTDAKLAASAGTNRSYIAEAEKLRAEDPKAFAFGMGQDEEAVSDKDMAYDKVMP